MTPDGTALNLCLKSMFKGITEQEQEIIRGGALVKNPAVYYPLEYPAGVSELINGGNNYGLYLKLARSSSDDKKQSLISNPSKAYGSISETNYGQAKQPAKTFLSVEKCLFKPVEEALIWRVKLSIPHAHHKQISFRCNDQRS